MLERLQKVISRAGVSSRREAERLITGGRVVVNGQKVTELGVKVDPARDRIKVDGKPVAQEKLIYLLLNKPKGYVTTLSDPEGRRTVADLVSSVSERVYPVGRLDYNTEGLIILTNDGDLTNILTHPRHEVNKTYLARIAGIPTEEKLDRLRVGVKLDDGPTAPAIVRLLEVDHEHQDARVEIVIHEGRNRQVRRMFETIGHPVKQLKRAKFAFLTLEGVRRGEYRSLTAQEVEQLRELGGSTEA